MRRVAAVTAVLIAAGLLAPVAGAAGPGADAVQARAAKATWRVNATINTEKVIADENKVVVRGRVKPYAAGQKVVLQQRLEGKERWAKSGKTRIKRNGTFKLTDKPEVGGVREYRVFKSGSDGLVKGVSKTFAVTVFAWQNLTAQFTGPRSEALVTWATIGTRTYAPSIVQTKPGTPGYAEFTLGRLCTSLEATYALTDTSQTGSTGSVQVVADGTPRFSAPLSVGTIAEQTLDLTDVYRLRFDLASSAAPDGYATVGLPRVLCAR